MDFEKLLLFLSDAAANAVGLVMVMVLRAAALYHWVYLNIIRPLGY